MEDTVRALQQQVSALSAQNAALEAELRGQQNIAQGLAELPGAITTMLHKHRREGCLLTRKAWESHQCSQAESKISTCGRELRVWCVPECAWSFGVCSRVTRRGHSDIPCTLCA